MEVKLRADVVLTLNVELTEEEAKALVNGRAVNGAPAVYTLRERLSLSLGIPLPGNKEKWNGR